jgi:hypothetical protein
MIDERRIEKDMEGSDGDVSEILSKNMHGKTE